MRIGSIELKLFISSLTFILGLILLLSYDFGGIQNSYSGGTGTIRVPIAWCAVNGSQATNDPTTTDMILWNRHERATDYIYLLQGTGITFRSAINDAVHGSFNFPIINDPDPNLGSSTPGNVTAEDPYRVEMKTILNSCEAAWQNLSSTGAAGGKPGILNGIETINMKRFVHSPAGTPDTDLIGKMMTYTNPGDPSSIESWSNRVFVMDNCYTFVGGTCGDPGGTSSQPHLPGRISGVPAQIRR